MCVANDYEKDVLIWQQEQVVVVVVVVELVVVVVELVVVVAEVVAEFVAFEKKKLKQFFLKKK